MRLHDGPGLLFNREQLLERRDVFGWPRLAAVRLHGLGGVYWHLRRGLVTTPVARASVMSSRRAGERWIRVVSALVLAACLTVVGVTVGAVRRSVVSPDGRTGYHVGDQVDVPTEWFRGAGSTLLVFLRSDCPASQALVKLLPEMRRDVPAGIDVVAVVSARAAEKEIAFAEAAGFGRQQIRTVDFQSLHLKLVPTLLLTGRDGVVKMERLGTSQRQGEIDLPSELSRLVAAQ